MEPFFYFGHLDCFLDLRVNGISNYLRTIRALFNKAIKDDIISADYCLSSKFKIKNERTINRTLTVAEVVNLYLSADTPIGHHRNLFILSFFYAKAASWLRFSITGDTLLLVDTDNMIKPYEKEELSLFYSYHNYNHTNSLHFPTHYCHIFLNKTE